MSGIRKKRRGWGFLAFVIIAIGAAGWFAYSGAGIGSDASTAVEGAPVEKGALRISVVERGNLKAAKSIDLVSEVEGRATILWLIDEGVAVEPGDVVCQLDTSSLEDRLVQQEISVQNVEAATIKAEQNYEIQKSQNQSEIDRAARDFDFAKQDRSKYLDGDWPQELATADEGITLAEEELQRAKQDYEWSKKLAEKGFLEALQLDSDRLALKRSEIKLEQSKRSRKILEEFTYKRKLAELDADVVEGERELDRAKLQAAAKIVDFEAELRTTKSKFELESSELEELTQQIEKAIIKAPVAGMVVYAVERHGRMGSSSEPIQEGTEVRERQGIITIPAADGMVVEATLHESVLDKVEVGMPVVVTVDAIPDRTFPGRVKFRAVLPDQGSWWANPDLRVYRTEIEILETDAKMRPGMSCSLEILVEEILDATYMPLQSVFLDGGEPVCFITGPGGIEKRTIEVGQNNGRWVEVRTGVESGDIVALSQPAGFNLRPAPAQEAEMPDDFPMMPPGSSGMPAGMGSGMPGGMGGPGGDRGERTGMEGAAPGGGAGGGNAGAEGEMSREDRRAMFENMSDEERQKMIEQMRQRGGGEGGARGERGGRNRGEGGGGRGGGERGGGGNRGGGAGGGDGGGDQDSE